MIKQRTLGRCGLNVSELCLGTMNFGWKTDEATSFAILDAFRAAGGNFLQAAAISPQLALPSISTRFAENVIGRWCVSRQVPRRELVLATRLNLRVAEGSTSSLATIVRERVQESMRRLQTDYLDLLVIEWNEELLPIERFLEAFDVAVRDCHVRYIGAANFPTWRVVDSIGQAFRQNSSRMEMMQGDYSLMTRARFEPELMALCREQKLGFVAVSPLAGGFLAQKNRAFDSADASRRNWIRRRFDNLYGHAALAAISDVAARHEATPAQVSLAWVLNNGAVSSAMIGVRSERELDELTKAGDLHLTERDLRQLADATAREEVRIAHRHPHHQPSVRRRRAAVAGY